MNTENIELFNELPEVYQQMVRNWPHDHVMHTDIPKFTGNALSKGRVANLLSAGEGPETFRILNKKASDKVKFAHWLYMRTKKKGKK